MELFCFIDEVFDSEYVQVQFPLAFVVLLVLFYRGKNPVFSFVRLKGCKQHCEASPPVKGDWWLVFTNSRIGDSESGLGQESEVKVILGSYTKNIDLCHIIVYGNYKPTIQKEAKDNWNSLIITYQGNKEVKDNKIDLFVQKYEEFTISDDELIVHLLDLILLLYPLKALDESFLSRNHVRKFLRDFPTKWRPKVTTIEESKDLSTLPLDELIGNLKVYEVVLEKDLEISKNKKEKYKSLSLKAIKVLSEEEASSLDTNNEEYAMAVIDFKKLFRRRGKFIRQPHDDKKNFRKINEDKKEKDNRRCFKCGDPNHFISDYPKHSFNDQKEFVGGCWSDSEEDTKKDEICLMAHDTNEVLSDTLYYSSSSLDNESLQNEYDKLCKMSLRIINKNKHLKANNEILKNETYDLRKIVELLERNK
ncbi:hypothetical protein Tco_1184925 [Tanacetum coccineum]